MTKKTRTFLLLLIAWVIVAITACDKNRWNDPHRKSESASSARFSSFNESPKTLDPALSYSMEETLFIAQIYEPPLEYHYLLRPYTLIPLTASEMPKIIYWNAQGKQLPNSAPTQDIVYTTYDIHLRPGIYYQPHPAFANIHPGNLKHIQKLSDFPKTATRELTAEDYVYEIKRLASPRLNSPIFGLMSKYIVGLSDYAAYLRQVDSLAENNPYLDLRKYPLRGAQVIDRYSYRITINGKYPQFIYWLAMPFFAPIPWEADYFYSQPRMDEKNINFDWYPVGTGAYQLTENNPNQQMVLSKNPNYHADFYPSAGMPGDAEKGLLRDAGKQLPFTDKVIFTLEKESIPRWSKFLQGYYDVSGISSDSFDQAIQVDDNGNPTLTPDMKEKGIYLQTTVEPTVYYYGFNMLDPVVGGFSERARKLRQALAIAIDEEEFINIFLNGRGVAAQGPIPPGIFGFDSGEHGIDPTIYEWRNGRPQRKSLAEAKKLLAEAGYPDGRDASTHAPLVLNYDTVTSSGPDDKARFDWMREQFSQLGIQLNIRATQYNRFQEKMRAGNTQIYSWGWVADYPDPENFLFLLYGPNGKVKFGGENASNYDNPQFDELFEKMRNMPNDPARLQIIQQMLTILHHDEPWIWGFHSQTFVLIHAWSNPGKLDAIGHNTLKYQSLNPSLRAQEQMNWNKPILWPLGLIIVIIVIGMIPVSVQYRLKLHRPNVKRITLKREKK